MNKQALRSFRPRVIAGEGASRRQKMRSRPQVEWLEGRIVMSTFRVNTTLDTVAVDLRTGKDATGHISLRRPSWRPMHTVAPTPSSCAAEFTS